MSVLWTMLIRSITLYGLLILPYLTRRKKDQENWTNMIRNSLKKYLKLENTSLDFMDSLLSKEEIMEEANYRLKLAKWKWE